MLTLTVTGLTIPHSKRSKAVTRCKTRDVQFAIRKMYGPRAFWWPDSDISGVGEGMEKNGRALSPRVRLDVVESTASRRKAERAEIAGMGVVHAGFSHRGLEIVAPLEDVHGFQAAYVGDYGHKPWTIVPAPPVLVKAWDALQAAQKLVNGVKLVDGKVVFT